jgi:GNAT superfamily N-acetyltransferase
MSVKGLKYTGRVGHNGNMATVLQLSKRLTVRPEVVPQHNVRLRHFEGPEDIEPWLRLREVAFARQPVGVRQWTNEDFRSEFLDKPWWSDQRMWLAQSTTPAGSRSLIGSVTWADRAAATETRPAVHWLAVHPVWRRRGIGRLLMSALEASCWDEGYRQIWLETHAAWLAAAEFYGRLGYEPA